MTGDAGPDMMHAVIRFIEQEVPPPRPKAITAATDLRTDLRMIWEDVDTMLERFSREFRIDLSRLDLTRYFPSERFSLFRLRRAPKPPRLTIGMLADAAQRGAWIEP